MKNRNTTIIKILAGKLRRDPSGALAFTFWQKLDIPGSPWVKDGVWEEAELLAFPRPKVHQWPYVE